MPGQRDIRAPTRRAARLLVSEANPCNALGTTVFGSGAPGFAAGPWEAKPDKDAESLAGARGAGGKAPARLVFMG